MMEEQATANAKGKGKGKMQGSLPCAFAKGANAPVEMTEAWEME